MRLRRVEVIPVRVPLPRTFAMTPDWTMDAAYVVLVRVSDDDDVTGIGYSMMYNARFHRPVTVVTESLAELLTGTEVSSVELQWSRLHASLSQIGATGIASLALGAIDVALWDLAGKRSGQPVFRLLGAASDRVDVYASATYFFQLPSDEAYLATAHELAERGFNAIKIDFPRGAAGALGIQRVSRIREAVGDGMRLMIDCTQGWTSSEAIRFGRELEQYGLTWIEDPLTESDRSGHRRLADSLDTPIATGEWAFDVSPLYAWAQCGAVDVIIGDVMRIGGLTPWKGLAAVTAANHIPLASHLYGEVSQHALAASPTALLLEYSDWAFPLLAEPPQLSGGSIILGDTPGLGVDIDESALARYRCD